jgi:hypothetical protein
MSARAQAHGTALFVMFMFFFLTCLLFGSWMNFESGVKFELFSSLSIFAVDNVVQTGRTANAIGNIKNAIVAGHKHGALGMLVCYLVSMIFIPSLLVNFTLNSSRTGATTDTCSRLCSRFPALSRGQAYPGRPKHRSIVLHVHLSVTETECGQARLRTVSG